MSQLFEIISDFNKECQELTPEEILKFSIKKFGNKITYICSFGTESAIILHMISKIDKKFPIFLLNTHFLFPETIAYKNTLLKKLNLTNCLDIFPDQLLIKKEDPENILWKNNTNRCCQIRKVKPLDKILKNYSSWISGRKSYHQGERINLKPFELLNEKIVVNPLISIKKSETENYFEENDLPKHPLLDEGYFSIGCIHCTFKTTEDNNIRSGRWKNKIKTECGIHLSRKN
ncbi:MAG: phosphoadenylyl-sulfate reductase [Rickettsiales bacterium]|nr:phosphoadenylyl-sulfate reductase [Rickettsiales bacterium]|tara:strand:+ start:496 stop:1191 length:696 start_codon:yes stop_codon:yes gene_type:complete